jgi:hypothetical protein
MSVVQKNYITVKSRFKPRNEKTTEDEDSEPDLSAPSRPPDSQVSNSMASESTPPIRAEDNIYVTSKAVAKFKLPDWFTNAPSKYKKIVRVLGTTINFVRSIKFDEVEVMPPTPGYRLFSNVNAHSNVTMKTVTVVYPDSPFNPTPPKFIHTSQPEGFIMMINNYNSVKEYDITFENTRELKFYLRPWNNVTTENSVLDVDFVCELELLLIDE